MRTLAIIISMVVAAAIAIYISVVLGILIALACVGYQVILEYQRSTKVSATVWGALLRDILRIVVFLIPIVYALLNNSWPVVLATVVVYGVNLYMS